MFLCIRQEGGRGGRPARARWWSQGDGKFIGDFPVAPAFHRLGGVAEAVKGVQRECLALPAASLFFPALVALRNASGHGWSVTTRSLATKHFRRAGIVLEGSITARVTGCLEARGDATRRLIGGSDLLYFRPRWWVSWQRVTSARVTSARARPIPRLSPARGEVASHRGAVSEIASEIYLLHQHSDRVIKACLITAGRWARICQQGEPEGLHRGTPLFGTWLCTPHPHTSPRGAQHKGTTFTQDIQTQNHGRPTAKTQLVEGVQIGDA